MKVAEKQVRPNEKELIVEYASQKVSTWPDWKRDIATKLLTTEKTTLVFNR